VNNQLIEKRSTRSGELVDYPVDTITPIGESYLCDLLAHGYNHFGVNILPDERLYYLKLVIKTFRNEIYLVSSYPSNKLLHCTLIINHCFIAL
jgi:hypothetical protein